MPDTLRKEFYTPERRELLLSGLRQLRAGITFTKENIAAGVLPKDAATEQLDAEKQTLRILAQFYPGQPTR